MAKSIGWWLQTLGLAERTARTSPVELNAFGQVLVERAPYLSELGLWWMIHASAVTAGTGSTLPWFFGLKRPQRSGRAEMVDALRADLAKQRVKPPSLRIVQREVAAMMQSYAVPVPQQSVDPEDNLGSPLQRLSLFRHVRAADRFERATPTPMPPEALGLVLSALGSGKDCRTLKEGVTLDMPVSSVAVARAGAMLGRNREEMVELIATAAEVLGAERLSTRTLAGERMIVVRSARSATWLSEYLDRSQNAAERAA